MDYSKPSILCVNLQNARNPDKTFAGIYIFIVWYLLKSNKQETGKIH